MTSYGFSYYDTNTTLTELNDDYILMDCSGGSLTLTIPAGEENNGQVINVIKVGGTVLQTCTVQPASGQIDGTSSVVLLLGQPRRFGRAPTDTELTPGNYTWRSV